MNLFRRLHECEISGRLIRVAVIGAGKFGSMFLSQIGLTPGMHLVGVADLSVKKVFSALTATGWSEDQIETKSLEKAVSKRKTFITDDAATLISSSGIDIVVEATGIPDTGVRHSLAAFNWGKHVVMVNVEADALCGPLLAERAKSAGVIYSMAYGDQPSLISEQIDWARTCGFEVIGAGKGTLYMPEFHSSTPDTVWEYYGISEKRARNSGMNAKMFNSFLDGTKSGIEMAAVSNACGLQPAPGGLTFPECEVHQLANKMIPKEDGGVLTHEGQVEVISSRSRDGKDLENDLRWGTFVTIRAPSDYVNRCFSDYGLITGGKGEFTALWRPFHLIGLELGISVANIGILKQSTGEPDAFRADVVAVAKRDLAPGETLDGEGGYMVWGRLMLASDSVKIGAIPIGLAQSIKLCREVRSCSVVTWDDVEMFEDYEALAAFQLRKEMELKMLPKVLDHSLL